ncbi:hypothetical protein ACMXYV_06610 [Neptuniibacter sp. SY11_33]|uniref:hypothetical protein n=1 Tax=Neptuniibacter sp. SY11_33 TaxID=3398215 RepID=UPI0039F56FAD
MSDTELGTSSNSFKKSFLITSLIVFTIGVILHDWLVGLFLAFFFVAWSPVIFKKEEQRGLGIYCGILLGLGLAIAFVVFGPITFYE